MMVQDSLCTHKVTNLFPPEGISHDFLELNVCAITMNVILAPIEIHIHHLQLTPNPHFTPLYKLRLFYLAFQ